MAILVTAFFGGTKNAIPMYVSGYAVNLTDSNTWTAPIKAADGVFDLDDPDAATSRCNRRHKKDHRKSLLEPSPVSKFREATYFFFKIGLNVPRLDGLVGTFKDGGKTWSKRRTASQKAF